MPLDLELFRSIPGPIVILAYVLGRSSSEEEAMSWIEDVADVSEFDSPDPRTAAVE